MTAASRVAGLARDVAVSAVLGASPGADAFFVAFRIPNMLRRVVAEGAASAAFVPVLTGVLERQGRAEALLAAAALGGASIAVLTAVTLLGMLGAPLVTDLFAPGFAADESTRTLTVSLTRWTFPYLVLVGTAAWSMGVHHSLRRFAVPAAGPVVMNLAIIACALALAPRMAEPAWALVAGVLVGGAVQVALQVPSLLREGIRPRGMLDIGHPAVRSCGRAAAGVVAGGSVYQASVLLATLFASLLPSGTVSWLWYADRVLEFPLGIVAAAVGTAALPSLSAQAAARRYDELADTVVHAMSVTLVFCLPAAVGLFLLAPEITGLLFERGSFGSADTERTAMALRAAAPGVVGVGLVRVLSAAFFAMGQRRVPVLAGAATLVWSALLSIALMGKPEPDLLWWGAGAFSAASDVLSIADLRHAGLALATAIAATTNALLLAGMLGRRLPTLRWRALSLAAARSGVAAAAMAVAVTLWSFVAKEAGLEPSSLPGVAGGVVLGAGAYLSTAVALGSREIGEVLAFPRSGRR